MGIVPTVSFVLFGVAVHGRLMDTIGCFGVRETPNVASSKAPNVASREISHTKEFASIIYFYILWEFIF